MDHLVNEPGSPLPPTIDVDSMKEAVSRVHALIDQELDRGIESQRIVLAGFSQGCAISLLSLLSTKHKVGGLMCLSGWLPMIDEIHRDANGTMHPVSKVALANRHASSSLSNLFADANTGSETGADILGTRSRRYDYSVSVFSCILG